MFSSNRHMDSKKMKEKMIKLKHYSNHQTILLVGEGDFSFALCLAKAFGSASNIVATTLHSKESLLKNYSRASTNLEVLEKLGCTILYEVDANDLWNHPVLLDFPHDQYFDRIVFNFPHAGSRFPDNNPRQIGLHQELLKGFFMSGKIMLIRYGEIHVTMKNDSFCKWEVEKVANEEGLKLSGKVHFQISDYPHYINKIGSGNNCDQTFPLGDCSTFKFIPTFDFYSFTESILKPKPTCIIL